MTAELFFTIVIIVFGGFVFSVMIHDICLAIMEQRENEKDAIRKYEVYGNRLFETVVYVHEITEYTYYHFYKAVLYEIVGKKKIIRDCIETEKENLIPLAETMLLKYLTEEVKEEIKQKTFEKMLDNFAEM